MEIAMRTVYSFTARRAIAVEYQRRRGRRPNTARGDGSVPPRQCVSLRCLDGTGHARRQRNPGHDLSPLPLVMTWFALATGATLQLVGGDKPYAEMHHDHAMAEFYRRNSEALGRPFSNLGEWETRP